jgi:hypothetical protein
MEAAARPIRGKIAEVKWRNMVAERGFLFILFLCLLEGGDGWDDGKRAAMVVVVVEEERGIR